MNDKLCKELMIYYVNLFFPMGEYPLYNHTHTHTLTDNRDNYSHDYSLHVACFSFNLYFEDFLIKCMVFVLKMLYSRVHFLFETTRKES